VSGDDRFIESQGCYLDSNIHGEFITRTGTGGHYTPSLCMQECREQGSRYAGVLRWNVSALLSSSSSSFISDTGSIEVTIKQHIGQTGNIQKYTQNDQSNAESERDKDKNKNIENNKQLYVMVSITRKSHSNAVKHIHNCIKTQSIKVIRQHYLET